MAYTSKYTGAQIDLSIDRLATLNPSADGTLAGVNINGLFVVGGTKVLANPHSCTLYVSMSSIIGAIEYSYSGGSYHYFTTKIYNYTCSNAYTLYISKCTKSGTTYRCTQVIEKIIG